jgi:hypothetical protein
MADPRLPELFAVAGAQLIGGTLWAGLALLTVGLIVLLLTRWGQSEPLGKCVVLSLWAHLLMAVYAATVDIVFMPPVAEIGMNISSVDGLDGEGGTTAEAGELKPWEQFAEVGPRTTATDPVTLPRSHDASPQPARLQPAAVASVAPEKPNVPPLTAAEVKLPEPAPLSEAQPAKLANAQPAEPITAPTAQKQASTTTRPSGPQPPREAVSAPTPKPAAVATSSTIPGGLLDASSSLPRMAEVPTNEPGEALAGPVDAGMRPNSPVAADKPLASEATGGTAEGDPAAINGGPSPRAAEALTTIVRRGSGSEPVAEPPAPMSGGASQLLVRHNGNGEYEAPAIYQLRLAPNRTRFAERQGGSAATEAAVSAALRWLATHQSANGRWDASDFGAGRELKAQGQDRKGAGNEADTGVTGLALLAFLGAGHTHQHGAYAESVAKGLDYLVAIQGANGNLAGKAETFAFMYCHGMAALALSEAYAMTGDERLHAPVSRAVGFTLAAQHRTQGGWRYRPGDQGDTSQLGWQLMVLKSAELAGLPLPQPSRDGMIRYLKSVATGSHGGLAGYRPGEATSRTMTAEALVCRQFLGMSRRNAAGEEAGDYLLEELPGNGPANFYYWYYATLGLYQLQGTHWRSWNDALTVVLVGGQRKDGDLAGSWDPDPVWGGHGGRVYSTALGALCLEVYYRFLPLYVEAARQDEHIK